MPAVTMPKLSDTMEEGKILRWLKHPGDHVEAGELLAEVETDKADMELEASDSGVLTEIKLAEGQMAPVGAVIAVIGEEASAAKGAPDDGTRKPTSAAPAHGGASATPRAETQPAAPRAETQAAAPRAE